jgi:hypothetical protein
MFKFSSEKNDNESRTTRTHVVIDLLAAPALNYHRWLWSIETNMLPELFRYRRRVHFHFVKRLSLPLFIVRNTVKHKSRTGPVYETSARWSFVVADGAPESSSTSAGKRFTCMNQ